MAKFEYDRRLGRPAHLADLAIRKEQIWRLRKILNIPTHVTNLKDSELVARATARWCHQIEILTDLLSDNPAALVAIGEKLAKIESAQSKAGRDKSDGKTFSELSAEEDTPQVGDDRG
jgi:hypothetical protein